MSRVLIVDDDLDLRGVVRDALERAGHSVDSAADGREALGRFRAEPPDLVISDVAMPVLDGHGLVRAIRELSNVPILVLTVRNEEGEKVRLLDAGADDYVVKPFGIDELLARVRVLLRRQGTERPRTLLKFGSVTVDFEKRTVRRDGREVHLTPTEFGLLEALAAKRGAVATLKQLVSAVWGEGEGASADTLRVHMGSLRKKVEENPGQPRWIRTEPWVGYRLVQED